MFNLINNNKKGECVMKDLVEMIAKSIVDNEKEIEVKEISGDKACIIELRCAKDDLGKLIGKKGNTAQSIRNIIYAASFKNKKRYTLDINAK